MKTLRQFLQESDSSAVKTAVNKLLAVKRAAYGMISPKKDKEAVKTVLKGLTVDQRRELLVVLNSTRDFGQMEVDFIRSVSDNI